MFFFFFKQKTASEMRISDWSSDVCSSDLQFHRTVEFHYFGLDPQLLEVAASQVWILAGDTQVRGKRPPHVADRFSNRKAAKIGRAHVLTPVTNAHLVYRLLLEKKNKNIKRIHDTIASTHILHHITYD